MNTRTLVASLLLFPTLAAAGPKDEAPLGVGLGSTVGGTSGAIVEKYLSESSGLQLGVGTVLGSGNINGGLGVYGLLRLIGDERGSGTLVYGADVRFSSRGGEASVDFGPSVGLQADVFVTPGLSIWAQSGVSFLILGKNTVNPGGGLSGSGYTLRVGPSHALATLGFTWWVGR